MSGRPAPGPVASTHLFRFRSPRDAARGLLAERRRLAAVPGLRFARQVFVGATRWEGFTIGVVDPRRQIAMCLWDDEAALDRFVRRSAIGRGWRESTDEYCEVRMTPVRAHGAYRRHEPLAGLPPGRAGDGPVALWTFANIAPRSLWFFWSEIRGATAALLDSPGLIAGTAGPERLYRGAMTFTLWQSLDEALRFSYRREPHRGIVREVRERDRLLDSMFIRFEPYAAAGAWPSCSRFGDRFERFAASLAQPATAGRGTLYAE
jgi:hypothetical protein